MTVPYGGHQGLQYSEHLGVELVVVEVERENPTGTLMSDTTPVGNTARPVCHAESPRT